MALLTRDAVRRVEKRRRPRGLPPTAGAPGFRPGRRDRLWRRHVWRILALWALVAAAYSNSFQAGLVFDNSGLIAQDPRIRNASQQNVRSIWTSGYWYVNGASGLYRPITTTSYLLNYAVFVNGPRPAGYHRVNLAVHAVNVVLVYALGTLIFGALSPALALAAVWGLHPLLTESVTNIAGRADLLAAFGVLAGLLCHMRAVSAVGRRRLAWLAGLLAAQAVGLFSKESAAVLPGLMLLYDLTWRERADWRRLVIDYVALALPFAGFLYMRGVAGAHLIVEFTENPLVSGGFWTARLTAVKVIGKFLWQFVWPARLSADYSFNAVPLFGSGKSVWEDAEALIALVVCLGAALLAALRWRPGKPVQFFVIFFFVAFAPTSNLIVLIGSIMAERFLYLPSLGLAGCAVAAIYAISQRHSIDGSAQKAAWIAMGLVCLAFAARTYARNFDWRDELSLWTSAVEVCPGSAKAHYNLGAALAQIPGRLPDAVTQYQAALQIRPDYEAAHYNLGNGLARMTGQQARAIAEYEAALRSDSSLAEAHYSLGNALSHMPGRLDDAITHYEAALRIRPDYADAHSNLGIAFAQIPGRLPEAVAEFEAVLRIRPDSADAHNNLGNALAELPGRLSDAIAEYQTALRLDPGHVKAHMNLEDALTQMPGRRPLSNALNR